jgi:type II secretory pathway component PulF
MNMVLWEVISDYGFVFLTIVGVIVVFVVLAQRRAKTREQDSE